jgi:hypothetical protein
MIWIIMALTKTTDTSLKCHTFSRRNRLF